LCTETGPVAAEQKQQKSILIFFRVRGSEKKLVVLKQLSVDRKTVHQHHGSQERNFLGSNDVFGRTQKTEASHYGGQ